MTTTIQRVGNYRIERTIGTGSTGQVVLGRHLSLTDRQVAIKLLLSDDNEKLERFQREAAIMSRLRHPNIVQIYDYGIQPPYYYTVMEYVPGGSLRAQMAEGKGLPLEECIRIIRAVGQALDYAHSNGVIHRDVAPGNILVEQPGGRVLLTDFGIAREADKSGLTNVGNLMGTPGYLSPEHVESATNVTPLSDIYSLGVVLFVLLTGRLPWNHYPGIPNESGGLFEPPKTLREVGVDYPGDLDRIIRTMLAKDQTKRYPTAAAAISDLEAVWKLHTSPTIVVTPMTGVTERRGKQRPTRELPPQLARTPHAVEQFLAADLLRGPLEEARRRSEALSDPDEIIALLDAWSSTGLRRRLLGRQAAIRRIENVNLYFYTLQVLYETRSEPVELEEPDAKALQLKLERELDRWEVKLNDPSGFTAETGATVKLPGSLRVGDCRDCRGVGKTVCPRCEGRGRITQAANPPAADKKAPRAPARTASGAQAATATPLATELTAVTQPPRLVACPDCSGSGGIRCKRCEGVGRLLQQKTFSWSRKPATYLGHDDLPRVDERWLRQNCKTREIYHEQHTGGLRSVWQQVPALAPLIKQAESLVNAETRIVLSLLSIEFIPVTELIFDLGSSKNITGKGKPNDQGLYSWHIYGFERRLPQDWRFLNWDRVLFLVALLCVLVLLVLLAIAYLRLVNRV